MSRSVVIKSHPDAFIRMNEENMQNGLRGMADRILGDARMRAPKLTGALSSDGRVEEKRGECRVVFGDSRVPYARRRHFENNLHPQTKYYLQEAGENIKTKIGIKGFL